MSLQNGPRRRALACGAAVPQALALTGLLVLAHPDLFVSAASVSGALRFPREGWDDGPKVFGTGPPSERLRARNDLGILVRAPAGPAALQPRPPREAGALTPRGLSLDSER
jgi:hypothetical protein